MVIYTTTGSGIPNDQFRTIFVFGWSQLRVEIVKQRITKQLGNTSANYRQHHNDLLMKTQNDGTLT